MMIFRRSTFILKFTTICNQLSLTNVKSRWSLRRCAKFSNMPLQTWKNAPTWMLICKIGADQHFRYNLANSWQHLPCCDSVSSCAAERYVIGCRAGSKSQGLSHSISIEHEHERTWNHWPSEKEERRMSKSLPNGEKRPSKSGSDVMATWSFVFTTQFQCI